MGLLIFLIAFYLLLSYSLTLLFPLIGIPAKKGWIPGVNFGAWAHAVGRSPHYAWWLLFPIVNLFIYANLAIEMVRSFDQLKFKHSFLAVIGSPIYFIWLAKNRPKAYRGPSVQLEKAYQEKMATALEEEKKYEYEKLKNKNPYKKTSAREWAESLIFAVFAAAFIRMFLIEAYTIPTSSMEDSLMVGDYLFVSKVHYGMRTPMTVAQFPLLHNRIPILQTESYLKWPSLPYFRFPAINKVKRNDPVVFNWPVGDSVFILPSRTIDIGQARRSGNLDNYQRRFPFVHRPLDKTDFYIKRCVATGGDSLEIIDRQVFINGEKATNPDELAYTYIINLNGEFLNTRKFSEWKISQEDIQHMDDRKIQIVLTGDQKEKIQSLIPNATIEPLDLSRYPFREDHFFPHEADISGGWSYDNFGPIYIPKKGQTISINKENLPLYQRIINVYENNDLRVEGDDIYINDQKTEEYTFQWNYYWMMGDNRHNSEDSRIWGFVPETHIVGQPLFIFFSTVEGSMGNGIRWDRVFKSANIKPEE
jgi:signal peptidase I